MSTEEIKKAYADFNNSDWEKSDRELTFRSSNGLDLEEWCDAMEQALGKIGKYNEFVPSVVRDAIMDVDGWEECTYFAGRRGSPTLWVKCPDIATAKKIKRADAHQDRGTRRKSNVELWWD